MGSFPEAWAMLRHATSTGSSQEKGLVDVLACPLVGYAIAAATNRRTRALRRAGRPLKANGGNLDARSH